MRRPDRILVIDDDSANQAIMKELLGDNYEVRAVSTGQDALEVISNYQPALILLDIMMPGMDGYEVCRRIRMTPSLMNTRIIMVSAKAMVEERLKGYQAGADDYIVKPFSTDELLAKVRVYLRMQSIRGAKEVEHDTLSLIYNKTQRMIETVMRSAQELTGDEGIDKNQLTAISEDVTLALRDLQDFFEEVRPSAVQPQESICNLQGAGVLG